MVKAVLKVLVVVITMVVTGCGGHINLIKNGHTLKVSTNPEVIFVIEDRHFSDWIVVGSTIEISSLYEISKAINIVFHDKAFAIYPNDQVNNIDISKNKVVKITPIEYDLYKPFGYFFKGRFIADVSINNKTKRIEAKAKKGVGLLPATSTDFTTLSNNTFLDFAKNLRKEFDKK